MLFIALYATQEEVYKDKMLYVSAIKIGKRHENEQKMALQVLWKMLF